MGKFKLIDLTAKQEIVKEGKWKGLKKTTLYKADNTLYCVFPPEQTQPHRNRKTITLNSCKYRLIWK